MAMVCASHSDNHGPTQDHPTATPFNFEWDANSSWGGLEHMRASRFRLEELISLELEKCTGSDRALSMSDDELQIVVAELKGCSHSGDVQKAQALLQRLVDAGVDITVEYYNYVIHACVRSGGLLIAEHYCEVMREQNIALNEVTYNLMINGCASEGAAVRGDEWFNKMIDAGIPPNPVTYSTICKLFARLGEVGKVQQVMEQFKESGGSLNEYFYASLISACGSCDPPQLGLAEATFRELVDSGLKPHSVKKALARVVGDERVEKLFWNLRKAHDNQRPSWTRKNQNRNRTKMAPADVGFLARDCADNQHIANQEACHERWGALMPPPGLGHAAAAIAEQERLPNLLGSRSRYGGQPMKEAKFV